MAGIAIGKPEWPADKPATALENRPRNAARKKRKAAWSPHPHRRTKHASEVRTMSREACGDPQTSEPLTDEHTQALRDVTAERKRQIAVEGWTPEHDDEHDQSPGDMAFAAACYATAEAGEAPPAIWPWEWAAWKPKDRRSNLVRAAALLLAEIERLDRNDGCEGGGDEILDGRNPNPPECDPRA